MNSITCKYSGIMGGGSDGETDEGTIVGNNNNGDLEGKGGGVSGNDVMLVLRWTGLLGNGGATWGVTGT